MTLALDGSAAASAIAAPSAGAGLRIVPARNPWRFVGGAFALLVVFAVLNSVLGNPRWGWDVFAEWFFAEPVLVGLGRTLLLTLLGALLGFTFGALLALARLSGSGPLAAVSWTFVWIFRSIPLIVLLLILNNLGYLYETVSLGVPFTGWTLFSYPTTQLISPFMAAVLGLTLNQAAFSAEFIRGGLLAVDQGQHEAAAALGLPKQRQFFRIVLPQAMRSITPTGAAAHRRDLSRRLVRTGLAADRARTGHRADRRRRCGLTSPLRGLRAEPNGPHAGPARAEAHALRCRSGRQLRPDSDAASQRSDPAPRHGLQARTAL